MPCISSSIFFPVNGIFIGGALVIERLHIVGCWPCQPSLQASQELIKQHPLANLLDSFDILVDGGATSFISNNLLDFVTPPHNSNVRVKGFNVTMSSTKLGTVVWNILDDSGQCHALKIWNIYYAPA
jgi:hypothetical protein